MIKKYNEFIKEGLVDKIQGYGNDMIRTAISWYNLSKNKKIRQMGNGYSVSLDHYSWFTKKTTNYLLEFFKDRDGNITIKFGTPSNSSEMPMFDRQAKKYYKWVEDEYNKTRLSR